MFGDFVTDIWFTVEVGIKYQQEASKPGLVYQGLSGIPTRNLAIIALGLSIGAFVVAEAK